MARLKDSSVDAVKAAADIVAVVSGRTQLRRSGARFVGRCPFHEERTPSFSVSPEKGSYYCFGCQKGGDAIAFVRESELLDFVGAVEVLAERFGVPLEYEEASPEADRGRRRRERLVALLEQSAAFYERYLWESQPGAPVRAYLAGRGLDEEVCRRYRLGLAPRGRAVVDGALAKGYTAEELSAVGLAGRRGGDYFSGRLLFPLADERGRVVGFGARRLHDEDPLRAKYVNSPEGELFRKGSILYGLHHARTAIAKEARACVVEGYTDVLGLRQAGLEPVVASMGTALTEAQLRGLSRLTRRVYLCFDADAAGQAATLRGMELAVGLGLEVRVVTLPAGLDPADAAEGFEQRLTEAESYLGYRVRLEIDRAPDRQEAFTRVRELLGRSEDSPDRQAAMRLASDRLDLPRETQAGMPAARRAGGTALSPKLIGAGARLERNALAGVLAYPVLLPMLEELTPEHFDEETHRALRAHVLHGEPAPPELAGELAELDARTTSEGIDEATAEQLLLRLRERQLRRELGSADPERAKELQELLARVRAAVSGLA